MTIKRRKDFLSNNTSGVTGVCEVFYPRCCAFIASWREDGNIAKNKWFCYKILEIESRQEAFEKACNHRLEMLEKHYESE